MKVKLSLSLARASKKASIVSASVSDTSKVKLVSKRGANYSSSTLNVEEFMSLDGRYLSVPDNVVLEIKFPKIDIKGTVV